MAVAEVFRYMAGHRTECIGTGEGVLACCTGATVLVWNTWERTLLVQAGKAERATGVVLWRGEAVFVTARALHRASGAWIADVEFAAQAVVVRERLVAIGERSVLVVGRGTAEHGLRSGVCTSAVHGNGLVYASFENGKIFEISDVLGAFRAREVVFFRETVSSLCLFRDKILAGVFDGKVAVVGLDGDFVFARVPGEVRKVAALGDHAAVLCGDGALLVFDVGLRFQGRVCGDAVDVGVSGTALFVATARAVAECRLRVNENFLSPTDGTAEV